jgi:dephospho-CoA kinase
MIIGITSFLAAGKGTMSEHLKTKGFQIYSCSDIIRKECKKKGLEITRDNLQKTGNDLRKKHGSNILAKRLSEKINKEKQKGLNNFVVESIRNPLEIKELKKFNDFVLVFIDVDSKKRYDRAKKRLKEKEHIKSYENFIE